jgi:hypothetical protein
MRRSLAIACCVALVVLAGCSGGGPTTETAPPTETPADEPSPDSTPGGPAVSLSVGERIELRALARTHADRLDGRSYTLVVDSHGGRKVTAVDATGLVRVDDRFGRTGYRTATASLRNETDDRTRRYVAWPTVRNTSTGTDMLTDTRGELVVVNTTTVDGRTRYVLTPGIDYANASGPRPYRRAVVRESGVVANYTSGTYRPDRGVEVVESFTVSDVGATALETPDWVSRLRDAPVDPDADTGTVVVERPELDARLRVTGDASALDGVALRENEDDWLAGGFVAEAAVAPVVNPVVRDRSANTTISVGYDESRLPDGANERNVSLFVYNESIGTYVQMNTTVDAGADTVTSTRAHEVTYSSGGGPEETVRPTIAHPLGRPVVVAMHVPTYYEAWRDR